MGGNGALLMKMCLSSNIFFIFQNIDGLELVAGVQEDLVIAAHGTFYTSHCTNCQKEYTEPWMKGTDLI